MAAADPEPPPVVDPWEEPAPVEPPEPKREDPKPAKATDPTRIPPSLHMRPLPWIPKRPAKQEYQTPPYNAEPEPEQVEYTPDEPAPPPYPRSFVLRPLVLPKGMGQGSFGTRAGRETFGDVRLLYLQGYVAGAVGLGGFELFAGMTLNLKHDDNLPGDREIDLPFFQSLGGGFESELARNTALGMQLVVGNLDRKRRYSPSVFINHKLEMSERNAIILGADLDYNQATESDGTMDVETQRIGAYAGVTGRTQPSETFAMQLNGNVSYFKYVDDLQREQDSFTTWSAGLAFLFSVSARTDVSLYTALSTSETFDSGVVGVTLTKR